MKRSILVCGKIYNSCNVNNLQAPFDDQRLLFPPAAAILVASILYNLYKTVIPNTMIDFVTAGTMTGKRNNVESIFCSWIVGFHTLI